MQLFNSIITKIFDLLLRPFDGISPIWGLLIVSVVTGIVMVVIFKYTSNQSGIKGAKDKISAYLMEIRLFKDDMRLMFSAQGRILRTNLTYMRYAVTPMLFMLVPVVLILAQLGIRYADRPLRPGESALVKVKLAEYSFDETTPVSVETGEGLRLETPLLRIPRTGEIDFRIGAIKEGHHALTISIDGETLEHPVPVADKVVRAYAVRLKPDFWHMLLYPGQAPIPKTSSIEEIDVKLPPQTVSMFGWNINWLVFFFIASLVAGYSLKGVFKVEV
jgi:uncharacterized membrane protein (DUF106 family)